MRDGRLATGDQDGTIRIWNLATGPPELIVRQGKNGSINPVTALIELEDGRLAFSTANSKEITLWSPEPGKNETALPVTPGQRATGIARLAGGRLAVGIGDGTIELWKLR